MREWKGNLNSRLPPPTRDNDCSTLGHFGKYHDILCPSPQVLYKHCFQFLLGLMMVQRENKNNVYAKFWGTNKDYITAHRWLSWLSVGLLRGRSRVRTPAGSTLRILKYLRRKCCLCNFICKWLDFQVFSDKDCKR